MSKIKSPQTANHNLIPNPSLPNQNQVFFNLKDFDRSQWQSFKEWEENDILSKLMDILHWYSDKCLFKCHGDWKYCEYGDFPDKKDTTYTHPRHVTSEAIWARFKLWWKIRLIGHRIWSVFYIVFLDKEHTFWKSDK